mgnify:CR=1 FL=1
MEIRPLSRENIEDAIKLANAVFPNDTLYEHSPAQVFEASLEPAAHKDYWKRNKLKLLENFVAYDEKQEIIGVTGLYRRKDDPEDVVWLGWYCVDFEKRGKGYGKAILVWTIKAARERGFKVMKLWTTEDPNEAIAQKLYKKLGFKITSEESRKDQRYKVLYRELKI